MNYKILPSNCFVTPYLVYNLDLLTKYELIMSTSKDQIMDNGKGQNTNTWLVSLVYILTCFSSRVLYI